MEQFSLCSIIVAVLGIVSNSLSLSYFLKPRKQRRRNSSTTRLFVTLNLLDLLVCVFSTVLVTVWVQVLKGQITFTLEIFCVVYQVIVANLTGFVTCLIAVTRAVDMVWPFSHMTRRNSVTSWCIVGYFVVNILLAVILELGQIPGGGVSRELQNTTMMVTAAIMTAIFLLIILANLLCVVKLVQSNNRKVETTTHATITVVILSVIYCVCNVGFIVYRFYLFLPSLKLSTKLQVVFHSILLPLNSACNPLVHFSRKEGMRVHLHGLCKGAARWCKDLIGCGPGMKTVEVTIGAVRNVNRKTFHTSTRQDELSRIQYPEFEMR